MDEIFSTNRHLIVPPYHPDYFKVKSVVNNLVKNIQDFIPGFEEKFSVFLIDNPEPNAFVLPGGQIFVNTGLLQVTLNDDGLATVLAHEVPYFERNQCLNNS